MSATLLVDSRCTLGEGLGARQDRTNAELAAQPDAGGLFVIPAIGTTGIEDARFDEDGLE